MAGEKNILLVSEGEIKAIRHWPIELRALFDPAADIELARRSATEPERERREEGGGDDDDDGIPF